MTSEGLDVEQLEMENKREQQKIQLMKEDINFNLKVAAKSGSKSQLTDVEYVINK